MGVPGGVGVDSQPKRVIRRKTQVIRGSLIHEGQGAIGRRVPGVRGDYIESGLQPDGERIAPERGRDRAYSLPDALGCRPGVWQGVLRGRGFPTHRVSVSGLLFQTVTLEPPILVVPAPGFHSGANWKRPGPPRRVRRPEIPKATSKPDVGLPPRSVRPAHTGVCNVRVVRTTRIKAAQARQARGRLASDVTPEFRLARVGGPAH